MIRAKLISPTNLLLEHPLFFSHKDEAEFIVLGRKEYERTRREWRIRWIQFGVLVGILVTTAGVALMSLLLELLR
jgi:hypothetical protein